MDDLLRVLQLAVGMVFVFAGLSKSREPRLVASVLHAYIPQAPVRAAVALIYMLASVELLIGAAHLADVWPVFSASVTLLLLVTFLIFTVLMLNKGVSVPCMCFGGADAEPVSLRSIVRIGLLIIAEVAVVVGNTWIFSGTEGQSFTVSDRLYEALAGGSTVLIVSWALSVTDLVSMKGCKECRSTKRRRHVSRWRKEHVAPSL